MRRLLPILVLAAALGGSCSHPTAHEGEAWSSYYPDRAGVSSKVKVDQKRIVTWGADPKKKRLIGWMEEWRILHKGERRKHASEWDTVYHLFDATGVSMIGFITEDGTFYKFDGAAQARRLGEWKIVHTGLKVFYGISLQANLDFEVIDPYED